MRVIHYQHLGKWYRQVTCKTYWALQHLRYMYGIMGLSCWLHFSFDDPRFWELTIELKANPKLGLRAIL